MKLVGKEIFDSPRQSPYHSNYYVKRKGLEKAGILGRSRDNGTTWTPFTVTPDPMQGLPVKYRRGPYDPWLDPQTGRIVQLMISLDVEVDPNVEEPPVGEEAYYLRYRVSTDAGKSYLFDEPIIQDGYTFQNPFPGIVLKTNGYYLGDAGSRPILTRQGVILVPAQASHTDENGKMSSPGGGFTYTDVFMLMGTWGKDSRIRWTSSDKLMADPARSTRGLIEPTIIETVEGRILCVMRGSNGGPKDNDFGLPSHKWYAVSTDGGKTWSTADAWKYDTGEAFFSPSSMSQLIKHSNGRVFWIGNINPGNCKGNDNRYPLVMGEVDQNSLLLIKKSLIELDTMTPEDEKDGLNLSHFLAFEDRQTGDLVVPCLRANRAYSVRKAAVYRVSLKQEVVE